MNSVIKKGERSDKSNPFSLFSFTPLYRTLCTHGPRYRIFSIMRAASNQLNRYHSLSIAFICVEHFHLALVRPKSGGGSLSSSTIFMVISRERLKKTHSLAAPQWGILVKVASAANNKTVEWASGPQWPTPLACAEPTSIVCNKLVDESIVLLHIYIIGVNARAENGR